MTPYLGVTRDQNLRPDSSVEKLAKLKPVFGDRETGTMTAANSTPLTDGAAVVLLGSEEWAEAHDVPVLAYLTHAETAAVDYVHGDEGLLMAPVYAVPRMLERAGLTLQDFDLYEIHEAFASQVLTTLAAWEGAEFCRDRLGLDARWARSTARSSTSTAPRWPPGTRSPPRAGASWPRPPRRWTSAAAAGRSSPSAPQADRVWLPSSRRTHKVGGHASPDSSRCCCRARPARRPRRRGYRTFGSDLKAAAKRQARVAGRLGLLEHEARERAPRARPAQGPDRGHEAQGPGQAQRCQRRRTSSCTSSRCGPIGGGRTRVDLTTGNLDVPFGGNANRITTYDAKDIVNLCVHKGDYIALSTSGGFNPDDYPGGAEFAMFGAVRRFHRSGSSRSAGGDNNGSVFKGRGAQGQGAAHAAAPRHRQGRRVLRVMRRPSSPPLSRC